jgi:S1-C subfamily serine protease
MPEPAEYERQAILLRRIATVLYGLPRPHPVVPLEELYAQFPSENDSEIDSLLKRMENRDLLVLKLKGAEIGLLGHGKARHEQNCVAEMVLGPEYIIQKYKPATVHIIVEGKETDESGGTGFFTADLPHTIITAAHIAKRKILRIENAFGEEIAFGGSVRLPTDDLDLAILDCEVPDGIEPIRVEWSPTAFSEGAEMRVFGYPQVGGHFTGFYQSKAELHGILQRYSRRNSLLISGTYPGCSGGPVMDVRGFAVGVTEQESIQELNTKTSCFFGATPLHYLTELL